MTKRTEQVGDAMQRILSELIQYELKDPRVGFATVVSVDVSGDLQHARVHISVMGDAEQRQETMAGLERAKGFCAGASPRSCATCGWCPSFSWCWILRSTIAYISTMYYVKLHTSAIRTRRISMLIERSRVRVSIAYGVCA